MQALEPPGALAGYRVLEWTGARCSAAAAYAGKLLVDLGAEVIKVEPPEGDPVRRLDVYGDRPFAGERLEFTYLNRGKRSVCLRPEDAEKQRALCELAASADA